MDKWGESMERWLMTSVIWEKDSPKAISFNTKSQNDWPGMELNFVHHSFFYCYTEWSKSHLEKDATR